MVVSFVHASVRALAAAVVLNVGGPAFASPAIPIANDANQRCVSDNFRPTYALVQRRAYMREAIQAELKKSAPSWANLRAMIVNMQASDILFRREMHRAELMCLDKISVEDRISSLRFEFRKIDPPSIVVDNSRETRR